MASDETCAAEGRRGQESADVISYFERCDPSLLRCRADVWTAQSCGGRRVLALVGSSPLGGRLLRSLRYGCNRVPLHAAEAAGSAECDSRGVVLNGHLPERRHYRNVPSSLLHGNADLSCGAGCDL